MSFSTRYEDILEKVESIDPTDYWQTRNFIDGGVTRLSPYIARGVISTKQVFDSLIKRGYDINKVDKFIQELAWRDYWQQVWINKGDAINKDLRHAQLNVQNRKVPTAITSASTGIAAIDDAIEDYYKTGYLHNHVRMYVASITCNLGGSHWREPARWMYYHLLDGDWASNALSWQWVAGANAGKKYYANQWNINKFCYTHQKGTFLDVDYSDLEEMTVPDELQETHIPELSTPLPPKKEIAIDSSKPTLIYNYYNLDPVWHKDEEANRVLLLEPTVLEQYPISPNAMNFMLELSKNIDGIQTYVGEFDDLVKEYALDKIKYKEHPLNNYNGQEESRDWMFGVTGYFPSFFGFWKKCKKELKQWKQPTLFG